jgi:ppGpp synthetase/RelA/SpoT-type nucleotidyltranferase
MDHGPAERLPRTIQRAVDSYARDFAELSRAGTVAVTLAESILDEAGINYLSVTGRTKSIASFAEKATRRRPDGRLLYPDPLTQITDQIGIRVITYVHSDVDLAAALLADQLVLVDDRDMGQETADEGRFGYVSRHVWVRLDEARQVDPTCAPLHGRIVQVQIRTVLQHAWAEFEHDIRYKGTIPEEHRSDFDRRFTLAAGLLELADREFSTIRDTLRAGTARPTAVPTVPDDDPRLEPRELAAFLAAQYPDAGWSRSDHYAWISGLLLELGITSFDELAEVLRPTTAWRISERMDYRTPPGAVRRLDDALLAAFGTRYVELHGNTHRTDLLRQRLERLDTSTE